MILSFSEKITCYFIAHGILDSEDKEVYSYSFQIMLATIMSFLVLLALSAITKTMTETAMYLLGFIPLRQVSGGYHAKNHFRCFLILMLAYATFIISLNVIPIFSYFTAIIILSVISFLLVFMLSPVGDVNKPLSEKEIKVFKVKSRISIFACILIALILYRAAPDGAYALSFIFGVAAVALSLLASVVKNMVFE